jgi:hypothetical protein
MALTNNELQALRSFFHAAEGKLYVAMLEKKLAEADANLRTATGEDLYRKQGRAQQLHELIGDLIRADQILKRQEQPARPSRFSALS